MNKLMVSWGWKNLTTSTITLKFDYVIHTNMWACLNYNNLPDVVLGSPPTDNVSIP